MYVSCKVRTLSAGADGGLSSVRHLQLSLSRALESLARLARFDAAFMILVPTVGYSGGLVCLGTQIAPTSNGLGTT